MAIDGRIRSGPMHTPTTTTRDSSGAAETMESMMPGTPTHSKMTGAFGPAPSRSAAREAAGPVRPGPEPLRRPEDVVPPGDPAQLGHGVDEQVDRGRQRRQMTAVAGGVGRRLDGRIDHDIRTARRRERPAGGGEVAGDDCLDAARLQRTDDS